MKIENEKELFEALCKVDDGHFIIVENGCVEVYSRDNFVPTPMSNNLASCKQGGQMKKKHKRRCHAKGRLIVWPGRMDRCQKSDCKKCHCYYQHLRGDR